MSIASRTPEGNPSHCPIYNRFVVLETSLPFGDAACPNCGQLLRWFAERLAGNAGIVIDDSTRLDDVPFDSIDLVEFVMEVEEEFDIRIRDEDAERLKTLGDVIRFLSERRNLG